MKVDELAKTRYNYNKSVIKLHHIKELIKRFRSNKIDYKSYYKYILTNNHYYWNFVNPFYCKFSFCTIENVLKFLVLKNLIRKQKYKINIDIERKQNYNIYYYYLYKEVKNVKRIIV